MSLNFEELLDKNLSTVTMKPGSLLTGIVIDILDSHVIVHVGLKSEAAIAIQEFVNEKGDVDLKVGDEVGDGRLMAKVHYPSDQAFGKVLGDELYNYYYSTKGLKLKEITLKEEMEELINQKWDYLGFLIIILISNLSFFYFESLENLTN